METTSTLLEKDAVRFIANYAHVPSPAARLINKLYQRIGIKNNISIFDFVKRICFFDSFEAYVSYDDFDIKDGIKTFFEEFDFRNAKHLASLKCVPTSFAELTRAMKIRAVESFEEVGLGFSECEIDSNKEVIICYLA